MQHKTKPVYIIAEIGINHNGSLENCYKLIDAAAKAGCNAAKFQFFIARNLYPRSAGSLEWRDGKGKYSYDIYKAAEAFELSKTWIAEIIEYCRIRKIDFLSSVSDTDGVRYLVRKGMDRIKIPSYSITNIPLLEKAAAFKLPMIMSTGGSTLGEVEEALAAINKYHNNVSLLHCSITYPTRLSECNLGIINTLRYAFPENAIGYSDHTKEVSDAAVQAVYLGARIIEKHITLDKRMRGPDHFFALEPLELKEMTKAIRRAEIHTREKKFEIDELIYGNSAKIIYPHEKYLRDFAFMKLFAKHKIIAGRRIRPSDISILRPGKKRHGLDPKYIMLLQKNVVIAKRNIGFEEPIKWSDILA